MQKVRAKFACTAIELAEDGSINITLHVVSSGSEENEKFFKHTPIGQVTFNCVNEEASALFKLDREYYVDFEEALVDAIEATEASAMDQTTPTVPPPPKP